jgi:hypothetical protein
MTRRILMSIANKTVKSSYWDSSTYIWKGQVYDVPSDEEIQDWMMDGDCETSDGDVVEPDHPDSWLRLLRLI